MPEKLFELLKKDHRQVEKWMSQIAEGAESKREELFPKLQDALEMHMQMEEKLFYPQLKKIKELKALEADAEEEHEKTKKILVKLDDLKPDDAKWVTAFQKLQEGLLHHIQDEEKKIFPECTNLMDAKLLREIGEKCTAEKEHAQTLRQSSGAKPKTK
jgi:iron-sulfur cluster repair protein YtfE (RIC family)